MAVVNSFECDEAVQEMRRMLIDGGQNDTSNLFTIVKNDMGIEILPWFIEEVSLVIQQVYDEIMRFLATICIENDRLLFVGNFVFNRQGGINPRETVLRALDRNIFSAREQFEFSCKYLFDEEKILKYFKNLIPHNIEIYFNGFLNASKLHTFSIFYWVIKVSTEYFENVGSYPEITDDFFFIHKTFIDSPYKLILCSEIAIQYLFENLYHIFVCPNIVDRLIREPETHRINILMYFLFYFGEDDVFTRIMLKLGLRKYFTLWDEFVQLIPIREINFMKNMNEKDYAE
ncbi:Glycosylated lysosomal membrane protein B, partial [Armadillidium vulgare]